eukprot:4623888-Pleurochrysis_carterae.AAC.1
MHHYPNVEDDPGVEEWLDKDKWSFDRVFVDVRRWIYDDRSKVERYTKEWDALQKWHVASSEASAVKIGTIHRIGPALLYGGGPSHELEGYVGPARQQSPTRH